MVPMSPAAAPAHPRLRGEHEIVRVSGSRYEGSSPPARGTQNSCSLGQRELGLIPACAGNTPASAPLTAWHSGSSPPARGTLRCRLHHFASPRLIPACAGNTSSGTGFCVGCTAHPRLRGEHAEHALFKARAVGSSPPARGTPEPRRARRANLGLIPACAGNTSSHPGLPSSCWAHPRLRGEHPSPEELAAPIWGSSPPARGTLRRILDYRAAAGLIPACAGNTRPTAAPASGSRAHPRLRGEHPSPEELAAPIWGSSPPARGTLPRRRLVTGSDRLIPACAGNTVPWQRQQWQ